MDGWLKRRKDVISAVILLTANISLVIVLERFFHDWLILKNSLTWKMISDPLYGYVYYSKEIDEQVINNPLVQRLRLIMQLQTAHLVYPGATHTRFQHSVGVMHLAGIVAEDFANKIIAHYGVEAFEGYRPATLIQATRIAGLLHDIGHVAFGHAFEKSVLWKLNVDQEINNHEKLGYLVYKIGLEDVVKKLENQYDLDNLSEVVENLLSPSVTSRGVLKIYRWIVRDSMYPADVVDFLRRDSYYAGTTEYGSIMYERLYANTFPYIESDKKLLLLDRVAFGEFRQYLMAKANMYEHVYYHSVLRAFDLLLDEILEILAEKYGFVDMIREVKKGDLRGFIALTDVYVYSIMLKEALYGEGRLRELSEALILKRKPLMRRIGREYIISGHKGPEYVAKILSIIYNKRLRENIRRAVQEDLVKSLAGAGVEEKDIWVDILDVTPIPKSILFSSELVETQPVLHVGKKTGRNIVYDGTVNLFMEGLPLYVVFRAYVNRAKYSADLEPLVSKVLSSSVEEMLNTSKLNLPVSVKDIIDQLSQSEMDKYKLTM